MSDEKFAMVFPGQGSQKIGMLADIASAYPSIQETFAEASEVLSYDLWALAQEGPQEAMNLTEKTQPLLLASSVALWRVWQSLDGRQPSFMAGHSLGEFSALVCAGVLSFSDAVDLVRQRGQFMQSAVPVGVGSMAAIIGLADEKIIEICQQISAAGEEVAEAVNFNSPGQVVIAGHNDAVNAAMEQCKAAGAKRALPLPVSAPFHTSLMKPAAEKLQAVIDSLNFSAPIVPIIHNVSALPESDPENIKALMVKQLYSAVGWTACMEYMCNEDIAATVECGPGKVLSGLSRRIQKSLAVFSLEEEAGLKQALAEV